MPASRRTEAPPVSPASADQGRDGWLSDLLNRADTGNGNREAPRGRSAQPAYGTRPFERQFKSKAPNSPAAKNDLERAAACQCPPVVMLTNRKVSRSQ